MPILTIAGSLHPLLGLNGAIRAPAALLQPTAKRATDADVRSQVVGLVTLNVSSRSHVSAESTYRFVLRSRSIATNRRRGLGWAGEFPFAFIEQEQLMDWSRVEGNWKQFTGKVKEQWGKLTDDDLTQINGKRDSAGG